MSVFGAEFYSFLRVLLVVRQFVSQVTFGIWYLGADEWLVFGGGGGEVGHFPRLGPIIFLGSLRSAIFPHPVLSIEPEHIT